MNILYLDTFSGISGDMFLGLLVDLGVSLEDIEADLRTLPVPGWRLESRKEKRMGITGTKVDVLLEGPAKSRNWADIDGMLRDSDLKAPVRDLARRIFRRIGVAEATVHGAPLEKVHFHEVGAVDSIVDIVGAASGLHRLGPADVVCAPLPCSRGMVKTSHGPFPLPAPATLEILRGVPLEDARCDRELVTPTGAAIAAEIARFASLPAMTLEKVGYGAGERKLADRPNLLRGLLGKTESWNPEQDRVTVLETHLDDANPEWIGALMERLLEKGALDAACSPLQMKKNRPGVGITVVCPPGKSAALAKMLLRESSAIGVRHFETWRFKLRREERTVRTPLGEARVKLLFDEGKPVRVTPEFESCRSLASANALPLPEVYRLVERAADPLLEGEGGGGGE